MLMVASKLRIRVAVITLVSLNKIVGLLLVVIHILSNKVLT